MTEMLPLFPLSTVLFPGMRLPLHLFEERYRRLARDLKAGPEPRRFAVVAIRKGRETSAESIEGIESLYEVGCVAAVRHLDERPDGRFDLQAVGTERFRLLSLDRSLPYFRGEIEPLPDKPEAPDEPEAPDGPVVARVQAGFRQYLNALADRGGEVTGVVDLPDEPLLLSYVVAAAMIIDLPDRQRLLAAPDAVARLRTERSLLAREIAMLRATTSRPAPDLTHGPHSQN
ncbi:MAG: LON peptidase substrate-binding domain-containing protein [Nocardiopsaceae bacterium]|nr:LON peptidase substrate-binding domain-containing protein [Nocardiopsaceae bacterium]